MTTTIIDYGVGNIGSLSGALEKIDESYCVAVSPSELSNAHRILLPGVGNFKECKQKLDNDGWTHEITSHVMKHQRPILGICLGMQLLATASEETDSAASQLNDKELTSGFDFISGTIRHLKNIGCTYRVPHIGWNSIEISAHTSKSLQGIPPETDFYFVHSYAFCPRDITNIVATTNYDINVAAVIEKDNIWGTQFHPEKSSQAGLEILKNFSKT